MSFHPSSWRGLRAHRGARPLVWSPDHGVFLISGRRIGRSRGPLLAPWARALLAETAVFALGAFSGGTLVWLLGLWS